MPHAHSLLICLHPPSVSHVKLQAIKRYSSINDACVHFVFIVKFAHQSQTIRALRKNKLIIHIYRSVTIWFYAYLCSIPIGVPLLGSTLSTVWPHVGVIPCEFCSPSHRRSTSRRTHSKSSCFFLYYYFIFLNGDVVVKSHMYDSWQFLQLLLFFDNILFHIYQVAVWNHLLNSISHPF